MSALVSQQQPAEHTLSLQCVSVQFSGLKALAQILCGVLRPTGGSVEVDSVMQEKPGKRALIGQGVMLVPKPGAGWTRRCS